MICCNKKCASFSIKWGRVLGFFFFNIDYILPCTLEEGNGVLKKVCLRTVPYFKDKYKLMFYAKLKVS